LSGQSGQSNLSRNFSILESLETSSKSNSNACLIYKYTLAFVKNIVNN
jgi:hypothetical protein